MNILELTDFTVENGSVVCLKWANSGNLTDVYKVPSLTVRFDTDVNMDADLATFMFMNLVAPCYAAVHSDQSLTVRIPNTSNPGIVTSLIRYHGLEAINIQQIDEAGGQSRQSERTTDYALLYGGGKDSLLSAAIHEDMFGADAITLLRLVWDVDPNLLPQKRAIIADSLRFMADRGFHYEFVESDFHTNVTDRDVGKIPNIALYPGLMAPLLSRRRFQQIAHGYDVGHFHMPKRPGAKMPFALVRPEAMAHLANALSLATRTETTFKNFNYGFNAGVAFKFLAKAYPSYVPNMYMCERLSAKWCLKCRKCFLYALGCLAYRQKSDFNLGYFFENSIYVEGVIEQIDEALGDNFDQIRYAKKFAYPTHLCSTVQVAHDIDLGYAKATVTHPKYPNAYQNLVRIIEPYKRFRFPDYDAFWLKAYEEDARELGNDRDGSQKKRLLQRLREADVPISEASVFRGYNMDRLVEYRF